MGEHLPCKQGVKGSNPSISTYRTRLFGTTHIENCIYMKDLAGLHRRKRMQYAKDRILGKNIKETSKEKKKQKHRKMQEAES